MTQGSEGPFADGAEGAGGGKEDQGQSAADEYKVGKNRPPLHSRFKKGNKLGKGRKKGSKNLATVVNQAANLKAAVKIGGEVKKLTKLELTIHQLANKASAGDLKASSQFLSLVERYEPPGDTAEPSLEQLQPDIETLRDYLRFQDMIAAAEEEPGDEAA